MLVATIGVMLIELVYGYLSGSLALTADGWHMGSHAIAIGLAVFAYSFARRHATNRRFTFGTGKVGALAGFASAILLLTIAASIVYQAVERFISPIAVQFDEALVVAAIGLVFNLATAIFLDPHLGTNPVHRHDHNLSAVHAHVLADALTSLLAIVALAGGKWLGWTWLDPAVGLVGALVIARWAWRLARRAADVLLDAEDTAQLEAEVRRQLEREPGVRVDRLRIWRLDEQRLACVVALAAERPRDPVHYRSLLGDLAEISDVTIEVSTRDTTTAAASPARSH